MGLFETQPRYFEGSRTAKITAGELKASLPEGATLRRDLDRFAHFSDGYLIWHPERPDVIGDARYAMLPNGLVPLWGIEFDSAKPDRHAPFLTFRERNPEGFRKLWEMVRGQ